MSRLLALLVAIGLVGGAVVVRNVLDDDRIDDGRQTVMRVTCAVELQTACEGLGLRYEVTVEDAAVTADRLASGEPGLDLWVVPQPWPAMVDEVRGRAGLAPAFDGTAAVARSPLVAVAPASMGDCDWRCLGTGDVRLGSRSLGSGLGVLELGAAAGGFFGDAGFAANDFDPAFRGWLVGFVGAIVESDEPVTRLLQSRAFFGAALSYEAEAQTALDLASADRSDGLVVLYPAPVAYVDVTVADADGLLPDRARSLPASLRAALLAAGWQAPGEDATGLPRAGVLVALRGEVR